MCQTNIKSYVIDNDARWMIFKGKFTNLTFPFYVYSNNYQMFSTLILILRIHWKINKSKWTIEIKNIICLQINFKCRAQLILWKYMCYNVSRKKYNIVVAHKLFSSTIVLYWSNSSLYKKRFQKTNYMIDNVLKSFSNFI